MASKKKSKTNQPKPMRYKNITVDVVKSTVNPRVKVRYHIRIQRNGKVYSATADTLDKALEMRDRMLQELDGKGSKMDFAVAGRMLGNF